MRTENEDIMTDENLRRERMRTENEDIMTDENLRRERMRTENEDIMKDENLRRLLFVQILLWFKKLSHKLYT